MVRRTLVPLLALSLIALPALPASGSILERRIDHPVGTAPDWFTPEFAARVEAAGPGGMALPERANVPMSSLAFLGIRPGAQIIVTNSSDPLQWEFVALCTANFVFRAPNSAARFIGTAGHCGDAGDKVFMIFAPLGIAHIGDIVQSTWNEDQLAPDFALISINPDLHQWISPSMAHWGGPTGVYTGDSIEPVLHSGHGLVIGTGGTPRAGVAYQWGDEWRFEGAIINGDSGSGAIVAGGLAAGNITHFALDTREDIPVWMGGTSMVKILSLVGGLELATCPSPIPWPLPGCPPV